MIERRVIAAIAFLLSVGLFCPQFCAAREGASVSKPLRSVQSPAIKSGNALNSLVAQVQKLHSIGDYEAVNQMKELHPELTQSPQALESFGFADIDLRNTSRGMSEIARAASIAPDDLHIQTSVVYGLYAMGSFPEALARIRSIVEKHPKDARSRAIQSLVLQQMTANEASMAALKEAEKLGMTFPVWEAKYNHAIGSLDQRLTIQVADDCLKALPNDTQVRMFHGRAMRNAGRMTAAAADFEWVLKADPAHQTALILLAEVYRLDKKYKQSIDCLKRRLKLARTAGEVLKANRAIAEAYEKDGDLIAAVEAREQTIAESVKNKECKNKYAMKDIIMCCRDLVALKRWKEALERINLVLSSYPDSSEGLQKRALCLTNLNRNAEAVKDFSRLIELHSDVSSWYRQRAELYKRLGKTQEAQQDLQKVKALEKGE